MRIRVIVHSHEDERLFVCRRLKYPQDPQEEQVYRQICTIRLCKLKKLDTAGIEISDGRSLSRFEPRTIVNESGTMFAPRGDLQAKEDEQLRYTGKQ